jgi:hypothetical protein
MVEASVFHHEDEEVLDLSWHCESPEMLGWELMATSMISISLRSVVITFVEAATIADLVHPQRQKLL